MHEVMRDPAFLTALATLLSFIVKWWVERGDKQELKRGVEHVAAIAETSHKEVVREIKDNTALTATVMDRADRAFTEANNFNLKLLIAKKEIAELVAEIERLKAGKQDK